MFAINRAQSRNKGKIANMASSWAANCVCGGGAEAQTCRVAGALSWCAVLQPMSGTCPSCRRAGGTVRGGTGRESAFRLDSLNYAWKALT